MPQSLLNKLHLDIVDMFNKSQEVGKVGSWLYIWETEECVWSSSVYQIYGLEPDTPVTKDMYMKLVHPDDLEIAQTNFNRIIQEGSSKSVHRIVRGGKIVWVEDCAQLMVDELSGYSYIVGTVRDFTEFKCQQESLERRRFQFSVITSYLAETTNTYCLNNIVSSVRRTISKVMSLATVAIFVKKTDGIEWVCPKDVEDCPDFDLIDPYGTVANHTIKTGRLNACEVHKYSCKEVRQWLENIGAVQILCLPIKSEGDIIGALSLALKTASPTDGELAFCNTICGYLSAQIKNALLYQQLEKELEERRQAEERNAELQRSIELAKVKTELFANLSHEFKTPINIILSSLELFELKLGVSEQEVYMSEYGKLCKYMQQNAYRLLHLSTNLIDSIKLDSGYLDLLLEVWDIEELITDLVTSCESYAENKHINLYLSSDLKERRLLVCDHDKVERVLLNLLSNAIKNTAPDGEISVSLTEDDAYIKVSVTDTGSGIDEKFLPYIFDKFHTANNGLAKNNEGSGIGLSIARAIVDLHGGVVDVVSKVGVGSTFSFTLSKRLQTNNQQVENHFSNNFRKTLIQMEMSDAIH